MEENELIDLSDVCDRIYKTWKKVWKQCIIIVLVCICLFEAKIFLTYQKTYTSSMTVVVSTKGEDILVSKDSNEETNNAFRNALMSSSMQKVIQDDLKVTYLPATLSVSVVPNTNFLVVSSTADNAKDAFQVIQSVEKNYGQITRLMNDANMIVLEKPELSTQPDQSPQYVKNAISAIVLAVGIDLIIIVVLTLLRRTITKEEHIKNKLHLKSLGSIPFISGKKRSFAYKDQLLVTNERIPRMFRDSFRSLVLTIERKKDKQVYMFTSTLPNEGKSIMSANTALTLAQDGCKVILIDLDLRNPSLYQILQLTETKEQIGDYLDEKCSLDDIIYDSQINNHLDVITGTKRYDHSIEMLSRSRLNELFEELRKRYDYIVVDVPPVLMMQDALSVCQYVDASILVIKQDYAKIYEIMDVLNELSENDAHVMGCILNSVEKSLFDKESSHYGYGYGYGYGK